MSHTGTRLSSILDKDECIFAVVICHVIYCEGPCNVGLPIIKEKGLHPATFTRVAPDIISGPGPGRNPAVFFQIRPRPDMTARFEAGFIKSN